MMRVKVALRRVNRFFLIQGVSSYFYDLYSLILFDLSLNAFLVWEFVRMLIFLVLYFSNSGNYRGYRDYDSFYGYKFFSRLYRYGDSVGVIYSEEFGFGRSGGNMVLNYFYGVFGKRLLLVVEDIIRRRNF